MDKQALNQKLDFLREKQRQEDAELKQQKVNEFRHIDTLKARLLQHLRPATIEDYMNWLKGYLIDGNEPNVCHMYNMDLSRFYVAVEHFAMIPLHGARALWIIVPEDIVCMESDNIGHCKLFFMNGFMVVGGKVPIYSDIVF